ncbi:MAG: hypothetical protein JSV31_07050 [Desulfobacterales bacterium]|nr:MAG: hypothetical protein JSV31_07050 [Desulfobacterales bacterium]
MDTFLKLKLIAVTILLILLFMPFAHPQSSTEQSHEEKAKKRELKKEAALNLWRLKKSIKEEGFYAARVALNIWRSNAMDAGTFDQTKYDEFKKQMYEKSVSNSLQCFEFYLEELSFHDANMCLQTWKVHSQEIGIFDQTQYEELQEKLDKARTEKNLEQEKMKEASD